jgi:hypothetical protein
MRKFLLGGLVLALTIGLAGVAGAKSTFTGGNPPHDQGLDFAMQKGGKQLTARSGPLAVAGENYLDPKTMPKKAGRVRLLFDPGVKLNADKFPNCSQADVEAMEGTSSEDAKKICGNAQLSIDGKAFSEATAAIQFGPTIAVVHPAVTAFNGPKVNGNHTIILHAFLSSPVANTTVLVGQLIKQGNRILLDVDKIPPLAGGLGGLTDFYATLNKQGKDRKAIKKAKKGVKKAKKGVKKAKSKKAKKKAKKKLKKAQQRLKKANKRISYIDAQCTGGNYQTTGTWDLGRYDDPSDLNSFVTEFTISGTDTVPCSGGRDTAPFDPGPGRG